MAPGRAALHALGAAALAARCGEAARQPAAAQESVREEAVRETPTKLAPAPRGGYGAGPTKACLERMPNVDVWVAGGGPLGGSRGTLRVDYDIYQVQLAFGRNAAEAKRIVRDAVEVASAVGAPDAERFVRRWGNVAASWGADPPTRAAARVLERCLRPRR